MSSATIQTFRSRARWLEARKPSIGGSDAPVVVGVSPYSSPRKLWAIKTGRVEPDPENHHQRIGRAVEPLIADLVAEAKGYQYEKRGPYVIHRHPTCPWATCTLDREIQPIDSRGPGVLQMKKVHAYAAEQWEAGPPLHVNVQVQHEMFVTGFVWGVVAAFVGGDDLRIYPVKRNPRFIRTMLAREEKFVACLVTDEPPPVDGSVATEDVLKKLHPLASGNSVELPFELHAVDTRLCEVKAQLKLLEEEERLLKNQIVDAMGDASYGLIPGGGRYQRKWITKQLPAREATETSYPELRRLKK